MASTEIAKAVRIRTAGDPEVMQIEEVRVNAPAKGEARVRHKAIGVNFIDVYHRSGAYPIPLPSGLGTEGAGVVDSVGEGVTRLKPGDRVTYAVQSLGSYSEMQCLQADRLVKIPQEISDEQAASMMLKGMTVQYLIHRTYKVSPGETVLFHAAAGGVGLIACQWLKAMGVTVIGTVGSEEKAAIAKAHGCDFPVVYSREKFVDRVKELTNGHGVPVVFDSVGKNTVEGSLECLRPRGTLVLFGASSGPVSSMSVSALQKGSLFFTRPSLFHHIATREDLDAAAASLFGAMASGKVRIQIGNRYPLSDVVNCHVALQARRTIGSTVLIP